MKLENYLFDSDSLPVNPLPILEQIKELVKDDFSKMTSWQVQSLVFLLMDMSFKDISGVNWLDIYEQIKEKYKNYQGV